MAHPAQDRGKGEWEGIFVAILVILAVGGLGWILRRKKQQQAVRGWGKVKWRDRRTRAAKEPQGQSSKELLPSPEEISEAREEPVHEGGGKTKARKKRKKKKSVAADEPAEVAEVPSPTEAAPTGPSPPKSEGEAADASDQVGNGSSPSPLERPDTSSPAPLPSPRPVTSFPPESSPPPSSECGKTPSTPRVTPPPSHQSSPSREQRPLTPPPREPSSPPLQADRPSTPPPPPTPLADDDVHPLPSASSFPPNHREGFRRTEGNMVEQTGDDTQQQDAVPALSSAAPSSSPPPPSSHPDSAPSSPGPPASSSPAPPSSAPPPSSSGHASPYEEAKGGPSEAPSANGPPPSPPLSRSPPPAARGIPELPKKERGRGKKVAAVDPPQSPSPPSPPHKVSTDPLAADNTTATAARAPPSPPSQPPPPTPPITPPSTESSVISPTEEALTIATHKTDLHVFHGDTSMYNDESTVSLVLPTAEGKAGLQFSAVDGVVKVGSVDSNTIADKAGVKPGMALLSINGKPAPREVEEVVRSLSRVDDKAVALQFVAGEAPADPSNGGCEPHSTAQGASTAHPTPPVPTVGVSGSGMQGQQNAGKAPQPTQVPQQHLPHPLHLSLQQPYLSGNGRAQPPHLPQLQHQHHHHHHHHHHHQHQHLPQKTHPDPPHHSQPPQQQHQQPHMRSLFGHFQSPTQNLPITVGWPSPAVSSAPGRATTVPPSSTPTTTHTPPTAMCPKDRACPLVNYTPHQLQYRHTCMLFPCAWATIPEHTMYFVHTPDQGLPRPGPPVTRTLSSQESPATTTTTKEALQERITVCNVQSRFKVQMRGNWGNVKVEQLKKKIATHMSVAKFVVTDNTGRFLSRDSVPCKEYGVKQDSWLYVFPLPFPGLTATTLDELQGQLEAAFRTPSVRSSIFYNDMSPMPRPGVPPAVTMQSFLPHSPIGRPLAQGTSIPSIPPSQHGGLVAPGMENLPWRNEMSYLSEYGDGYHPFQ